jgi:hypothetical protein
LVPTGEQLNCSLLGNSLAYVLRIASGKFSELEKRVAGLHENMTVNQRYETRRPGFKCDDEDIDEVYREFHCAPRESTLADEVTADNESKE